MESGTERNDPGSPGWVASGQICGQGESDPQYRSHRWDAFHLFVEHKPWARRRASRAAGGGESRSPALTSQAGGRCKPGNVQLLFIQQEAWLQLQPGGKRGVFSDF